MHLDIDTAREKCIHGYWTHAYDKCPWCFGFTQATQDVVPVKGPGNGWLLRKGQAPCIHCGGPGNAGFGIIPPGITLEFWKTISCRLNYCYQCSREGKSTEGMFRWDEVEVPLEVRKQAEADLQKIRKPREILQQEYPESF